MCARSRTLSAPSPNAHGLEVWMQPLVPLRAPKLFNLRSDLRACGTGGRRLRQMVHRALVCPGSGASDRGAAPAIVPGVPTAAEAGQLLGRRGDGNADEKEK